MFITAEQDGAKLTPCTCICEERVSKIGYAEKLFMLSSFPSDKGRNKNCNGPTIASFMILIHHLPSTVPWMAVFHTASHGTVFIHLTILSQCRKTNRKKRE